MLAEIMGTAELFAVSVWALLVGVLLFIWAEREMRDQGESITRTVESVAAVALFMLFVGIAIGFVAQYRVENGCGSDGLGQHCLRSPGVFTWPP